MPRHENTTEAATAVRFHIPKACQLYRNGRLTIGMPSKPAKAYVRYQEEHLKTVQNEEALSRSERNKLSMFANDGHDSAGIHSLTTCRNAHTRNTARHSPQHIYQQAVARQAEAKAMEQVMILRGFSTI
jgi:RNase P protein component